MIGKIAVRTLSVAIFFGAVALASSARLSTQDKKLDPESVEGILKSVAKTYAEAKSYRDAGVMTSVNYNKFKSTRRSSFETLYVRPDQYRLQFKYRHGEDDDEFHTYIAWRKGQEAKSWWELQGLKDIEPHQAFTQGAGVTGGYIVYFVPRTLVGDIVTWPKMLKQPERMQDMKVDQATWMRIRGQYLGKTTDFWIDRKTLLLRKVENVRMPGEMGVFQKIEYLPEINVAIPEKALEFNPPKMNP